MIRQVYSRLIVKFLFFLFVLLIDPYSHLRHWLPFFPHQTKELKHSIQNVWLQFRGCSAAQNTPPPNGARQNSRPYYFLCTLQHRRRHGRSSDHIRVRVLHHPVGVYFSRMTVSLYIIPYITYTIPENGMLM